MRLLLKCSENSMEDESEVGIWKEKISKLKRFSHFKEQGNKIEAISKKGKVIETFFRKLKAPPQGNHGNMSVQDMSPTNQSFIADQLSGSRQPVV